MSRTCDSMNVIRIHPLSIKLDIDEETLTQTDLVREHANANVSISAASPLAAKLNPLPTTLSILTMNLSKPAESC